MLYFETSFLVPLVFVESTSADVQRLLASLAPADLATSDWTLVEFASVMSREVRVGGLSSADAGRVDEAFQQRIGDGFRVILPMREDFALARQYVRDHATGLRGPDALHLAVAANNRAEAIYTLDKGMIRSGRRLGLSVTSGIRTSG